MVKQDDFPFTFDETICQKKCNAQCCRGEGYVFLNDNEINIISEYLHIDTGSFVGLYTKKVLYSKKTSLIDLRIDGGVRCVFLDSLNQCEIYDVRPKQCRTFPFWDNLKSKNDLHKLCPGIVYADK